MKSMVMIVILTGLLGLSQGDRCKLCMYMQADMADIQSLLDTEMEQTQTEIPYEHDCMYNTDSVSSHDCGEDQCLAANIHIMVDYFGVMQTGFRVYIRGCADDDFLQDHSGCSNAQSYSSEIISSLGDMGGATIVSLTGSICTCNGYNCNNQSPDDITSCRQ